MGKVIEQSLTKLAVEFGLLLSIRQPKVENRPRPNLFLRKRVRFIVYLTGSYFNQRHKLFPRAIHLHIHVTNLVIQFPCPLLGKRQGRPASVLHP